MEDTVCRRLPLRLALADLRRVIVDNLPVSPLVFVSSPMVLCWGQGVCHALHGSECRNRVRCRIGMCMDSLAAAPPSQMLPPDRRQLAPELWRLGLRSVALYQSVEPVLQCTERARNY